MAVIDQPRGTYDNTVPQKRVISDVIAIIDPVDTPVLALLGMDSARSKFMIGLDGKKIEILEDTYAPLSSTANHGTTITTTTLTITVADGSVFQVGHTILIDAEYMVISSISTDAITVSSRAYGGTNATHGATAAISIVGMARVEGADATFGPLTTITAPYNYTSIFEKAVKVTGTEDEISQYGFANSFMYQSNKSIPELLRLYELALFHGIRAAGSKTTPRSMGGFEVFITDNTVGLTTTITKAALDNLALAIHLDGGMPDTVIMNPTAGKNLRGLLDSSSFVRMGQENTMFGMRSITRINTQHYVDLQLLESRHCPLQKAYMIDSSKVGTYSLRPFFTRPLANVGDSERGEVIGEFSLLIQNDKAHGKITTSGTNL
jgi:hypothetical protein